MGRAIRSAHRHGGPLSFQLKRWGMLYVRFATAKDGAGGGSRTRLSCLGSTHNSRYTTPAKNSGLEENERRAARQVWGRSRASNHPMGTESDAKGLASLPTIRSERLVCAYVEGGRE